MREPATEDELAAILREGKPVHAVGNGTKLHLGPGSEAEPVAVRRLAGVTAYEPGDLVACVRAGTRLADLQAELARHGQWLPIDPPYAEATIGGILATNSSGPRRLAYGTMRDHLIGLRVMGPDGSVTRSGGRVVKNVTGYDLHKLHVGAFGTLGVLLEANFKVRPRPELSAAVVFACASFREAHQLLLKVHASPLRPVALEALDGRLKHLIDGKALAIVGVEGTRPVLDRHYRELETLGGKRAVLEGERAEPLWTAIRNLPRGLVDFVRVRIGAKPFDLPRLVPDGPAWAQVGTGIARIDLPPTADASKRARQLHETAAGLGGYAVVESAPPGMPDRAKLPWGFPGHALMRAIRQSRDPRGMLNYGRMVV